MKTREQVQAQLNEVRQQARAEKPYSVMHGMALGTAATLMWVLSEGDE